MLYRKLGQSDISVSEISLGCWTLGGLNWVNGVPNGWANVDEPAAIEAINFALDRGINHFDNADVYGNGRAERLLAKALGTRNKDVIIATKVGWFPGTAAHAYEPQHIRHQLEQSLINLRRDWVDIYYFHHADFGPNDQYLDDAVAMIYRLRDEGKIRLIGQSAYTEQDFLRVVPKVKPTVMQSYAHIMDDHFIRPGSSIRRLLENRQMSFIAFSPLNKGLLLGKYDAQRPPHFEEGDHRKKSAVFTPEHLAQITPQINALKTRFGKRIPELARVALQYLLNNPIVAAVIPGFRNRQQVEDILWGTEKPLSAEESSYIQKVFRPEANRP